MKIAFSGHRPDKLWGYDFNSEPNQLLRRKVRDIVFELLAESEDTEHTAFLGMALGFDTIAFQAVLDLQVDFNIKIVAAVPFKEQASAWFREEDVLRYEEFLSLADEVVYVDEIEKYDYSGGPKGVFHDSKLQSRNMYMADEMEEAVVLWNGTQGGTANFIHYARKLNKPLHIYHPQQIIPKEVKSSFR